MDSNHVRSSKKRTWAAIIQGVCGLMALGCGIALIPLRAEGPYIPYYVEGASTAISNVGFAIWGGVVISATAILGLIHRQKKAMISIYADFSLASTVMVCILLTVTITGLTRFATLRDSRCLRYSYDYYDYYDSSFYGGYYVNVHGCCIDRSRSDCGPYNASGKYTPVPRLDYESEECGRMREIVEESAARVEECRETIRKDKRANMSIYAILLLVSVVEFIVSLTAAVSSFIVVCRGCCTNPPQQQVVYLAYPANGQPGSAPMVLIPSMDPGTTLMAGVTPNTMASPYSPQMAAMNPSMPHAGLYPYPMPAVAPPGYDPGLVCTGMDNAVAEETKEGDATPPPSYEAGQF